MYQSMRDLMEAARDASRDLERCERQLIGVRLRAESLGGAQGGGVTGGAAHDRMERRVAALVDRERALERRMAEDNATMDLACDVLFGRNREAGEPGGLAVLVPDECGWWCWALWWHYIQGETWVGTGHELGYSPSHVRDVSRHAMEIADAYGLSRAMDGLGVAED